MCYNQLMIYNWQQNDWPDFKYDLSTLEKTFFDITEKVGQLSGLTRGLSEEKQIETTIEMMVAEATKTSEIEGQYLSRKDIMSSIRNNLGFYQNHEHIEDKRAEGAAELIIDVRKSYAAALNQEKLFSWHRMIMKGSSGFKIGAWRTHKEPMQVVSGSRIGKEKIHFEAPPSSRVPEEMNRFIAWFNDTGPNGINEIKKPAIRAAIAHLYFESIHPFEDGNGRVGRAISEKSLSQEWGHPMLLSLSRTISSKQNQYYEALEAGQRSNELSPWLHYFVNMVLAAQIQSEEQIDFTLQKSQFFDRFQNQLNSRQLRVVRRMFEEGVKGFEGGMSTKKYISITRTSKATATRDLQDLVKKGVFLPQGGGRSTRYALGLRKNVI